MGECKKFGELSRDEKLELLTAWVDGAALEWRHDRAGIQVWYAALPIEDIANQHWRVRPDSEDKQ